MAREHRLPPSASSLSESMRDLGYALETAVADIIDNSITAHASKIDVLCVLAGESPSLTIIDDGKGMSDQDLLKAMKHGSVNPKAERDPDDLGRFGLGLKTASFSQCRQLTVITSQDGKLSAAQWDLDLIDKKDDWLIRILDSDEISAFEHVNSLKSNGTMVVWHKLDRLFEELSGNVRDELVNEKLDLVERHLSLVFHRYLSGEFSLFGKIELNINGHKVTPFDPFCRSNKATQVLPEEKIKVSGKEVKIQPYILPHHSKLSASEYAFYQDRSDFISNQGAYIYRNGRLMAWGDWFRLVPKGEATKLARVQIDFPNALDESWTIDIKKSRARPPQAVRERMKQIIARITNSSTRVHKKRGKKLFEEIGSPFWDRYADPGKVRYAVNMDHPLVTSFLGGLGEERLNMFMTVMEVAATSLPLEMIYSDYSLKPHEINQGFLEDNVVVAKLSLIKNALNNKKLDANAFKEIVQSTRLFDGYEQTIDEFIKEEFNV